MNTTLATGTLVRVVEHPTEIVRSIQGARNVPEQTVVTCETPYRRRARVSRELDHHLPVVEQLMRIPLCSDRPPQEDCVEEVVIRAAFDFLSRNGANIPCPSSRRTRGCGVQFEWTSGPTEVSVEFFADGDVVVAVEVDGEVQAEDGLDSALMGEALTLIKDAPDQLLRS